MIDWLDAASTIGFPILVTLYLLTRFEKIIKENTQTIRNLQEMMDEHFNISLKGGRRNNG